jgi:hypothetical protein
MVAAAMSLELHGCGNHAVWSGAREPSVTEVRFRWRLAADSESRADHFWLCPEQMVQ